MGGAFVLQTPGTTRVEGSVFVDMTEDAFLQLDQKKLDSFLRMNNFPSRYSAAVVMEMVKSKKIKMNGSYFTCLI